MEIGYNLGLKILTEQIEKDSVKKMEKVPLNNRILFLTDAMPNAGGGKDSLLEIAKSASAKEIYTTFIGIGLNFNTELVDQIIKTRGCNYFSVENEKDFDRILVEEFNYIVTPLCFNTQLNLESEEYEIEQTYGSFDEDKFKSGEKPSSLMVIETIMASDVKPEKGVKGGIVLAKLKAKKITETKAGKIKLVLSYQDKLGKKTTKETTAECNFSEEKEVFQSEGIRKGILLVHFVSIIKRCLKANRENMEAKNSNLELKVNDALKQELESFKKHFIAEKDALNDATLNQELDVIDKFKFS